MENNVEVTYQVLVYHNENWKTDRHVEIHTAETLDKLSEYMKGNKEYSFTVLATLKNGVIAV